MTNINFLSNTYQTKQDPNVYAQQYATQNGISLEDAKEELKSKYGDPDKEGSIFASNKTNTETDFNLEDFDFNLNEEWSEKSNAGNIFSRILNMLKGPNGPQKEGDPQLEQEE